MTSLHRNSETMTEGGSTRDGDSLHEEINNIFDNNDQGLIDNPFLHWSPSTVERKTRLFAKQHALQVHEHVLVKAARILQDPEAWQGVPNLTAEEKHALDGEKRGTFWKQHKGLRVTVIMLCFAAVVQGWNQTGSNGANLQWPAEFGLQVEGCSPSGKHSWIFAAVNASTYLTAGLFGCWLSDPVNEYLLGRRMGICFSALVILGAVIGCAVSVSWRQLLGFRVLLGVGMGVKASVTPVFSAEIAPAHMRGALVMNWQCLDAAGIFLGFTANLILNPTTVGDTAWRWQIASSALPTIVLLSLNWVGPESPRFLMKHHRHKEAYEALLALRGEPVLAAKELLYVHFQMDVETQHLSHQRPDVEANGHAHKEKEGARRFRQSPRSDIRYWRKIRDLFTVKRIRRATMTAVVCMIGQQLCGVNVLAFYSSTFFCNSTPDGEQGFMQPLLVSWGLGLTMFVFAFPAYSLIDKRGRRWLLLVTVPFLALTMMAAGLSFLIEGKEARTGAAIFWSFLFMFFYAWGMGPVPFTISAEVYPLDHRIAGMSFSVFTNLFGAGLLTLFVPALTTRIGEGGVLGVFAGANVFTFGLVFLFVRETAGAALGGQPGSMTFMSLEELNYVFGVSTRRYIRYQLTSAAPWAWSYYVKRDKRCPPAPPKLYTWAIARDQELEGITAGQGGVAEDEPNMVQEPASEQSVQL